MRILPDHCAFSTKCQDSAGEEAMRAEILSVSADDEASLTRVLDKYNGYWKVEDFPNVRLFSPVLNHLDAIMARILEQFGAQILLPTPSSSQPRTVVSTAPASAEERQAVATLLSILNFTSAMLRNAVHKDLYQSLDVS